jgi:hypothetical protein
MPKKEESYYLTVLKKAQKNSKRLKPLEGSSYKNMEEVERAFKNVANKKNLNNTL